MPKTAAMKTWLVAYVVVLAILVQILLNVLGVLPILEVEGAGDPAAFVVPLAIFGALMVGIILTGALWSRAPRTAP